MTLSFESAAKSAAACTWCANCRSGCPSFEATRDEAASGRGRIGMLLALASGSLAPSPRMAAAFASCTRCGWCDTVCPVKIPVRAAIDAARTRVTPPTELGRVARLMLALLRDPAAARRARRLIRRFQEARTTRDRRSFPPVAPVEPRLALPAPEAADVVLSIGCRIEAFVPEAAADAAAVLAACGMKVGVASQPVCSGFLQEAWGAHADAAACAEATRASAAGRPLATLCGGCRNTARAAETPLEADDVGAWVARAGWRGPFRPEALAGPVFVHEPCTFRHGREGTSVLDLLRRAGVDAVRFAPVACCGGAAPACVDAPEESEKMGESVRVALEAAPPKTLVTSDPGCLLQFRRMTDALGIDVIHAATALRRVRVV